MLVYKIFRAREWSELITSGATAGSADDRADGFVHLSTAPQLPGTLAKHFGGEEGLVLAALDAGRAGPGLRWEASRGGALFPHLHRPLELEDVLWSRAVEDGPGGPVCPEGLE